jgi:hypothetical protein
VQKLNAVQKLNQVQKLNSVQKLNALQSIENLYSVNPPSPVSINYSYKVEPPITFGNLDFRNNIKKKKKKSGFGFSNIKMTAYTPTAYALSFGVRGKVNKAYDITSGFGVRPI